MSGNTALIVVFRPISLNDYLNLKLVIYSLVFDVTFILSHLWVEFVVLP